MDFADDGREREHVARTSRAQRHPDGTGLRWLHETLTHVYVIDLTHYLDPGGTIAPERGPARKFADFLTAVVAHATDFDRPEETAGPVCFECRKRDRRTVDPGITEDDRAVWHHVACGTQGQIGTTASKNVAVPSTP